VNPTVASLTPAEAYARMREGSTYVDVRSESEFTEGRPVGAINVPWQKDGLVGLVPNDAFVSVMLRAFAKDQPLVIGCHAGGRSAKAVQALAEAGFTALANQTAGFDGSRGPFGEIAEPGWKRTELPVERGEGGEGSYEAVLARLAMER
jgi:rhodanese-related sulfurtransferase